MEFAIFRDDKGEFSCATVIFDRNKSPWCGNYTGEAFKGGLWGEEQLFVARFCGSYSQNVG